MATQVLDDISPLAERYDAWFCDIWGVIHNGQHHHSAAVDACVRFRENGGRVIFITNAPRPSGSVAEQLDTLGVARASHDAIVSSGDVTRALINEWRGQAVYHLGPERDRPVFQGLDVRLSAAEIAQVIVNTGLFDDYTETPDDYRDALTAFSARKVPMICANPALVDERGSELCYCAGALAELYAELGGEVIYAGKPHQPIYEICQERLNAIAGPVDKSRILAIGDGLKTDMPGAATYGIDSLFIPSGVHVEQGTALTPDYLTQLFASHAASPVGAMPGLRWA